MAKILELNARYLTLTLAAKFYLIVVFIGVGRASDNFVVLAHQFD